MKTSAKHKGSAESAPRPGVREPPPIALVASDPEFLTLLGRRVRDAREQRGMARKVLCQAANISERYLAALEAGEGNASVILLRRVRDIPQRCDRPLLIPG